MSLNQIIEVIGILSGLGVVAWLVQIIQPVVDQAFEKLEAETKNHNLLLAEKWALEVVHNIEAYYGQWPSAQKKDKAVKQLNDRLRDNLLDDRFSDQAVSGLIEAAIGKMKGE